MSPSNIQQYFENVDKKYAKYIFEKPTFTNLFRTLIENHTNETEILTRMMEFKIWRLLTNMMYY